MKTEHSQAQEIARELFDRLEPVKAAYAPRIIQVIQTELESRGKGTEEDPIRRITQFYTLSGKLLAEVDPSAEYVRQKQDQATMVRWLEELHAEKNLRMRAETDLAAARQIVEELKEREMARMRRRKKKR